MINLLRMVMYAMAVVTNQANASTRIPLTTPHWNVVVAERPTAPNPRADTGKIEPPGPPVKREITLTQSGPELHWTGQQRQRTCIDVKKRHVCGGASRDRRKQDRSGGSRTVRT